MFCTKCGCEIKEESAFCPKCGKVVSDTENTQDISITGRKVPSKRTLRLFIPIAILLVVVLTVVVIIYNAMMGVKVINNKVEAGSIVQTKDIIIPRSSNGIIRFQNELDTSKLGQQALQYTIENGILSINRHIEIEVIDTTAPVISGPENIKVQKGELFNPADFYSVTDFDDGLENSIAVTPEVNINVVGSSKVQLSAKDSSGNIGLLDISVQVIDLTADEQLALKAINKYVENNGSTDGVASTVIVYKTDAAGTNGVDYYVEINSDVLYAIYDDGEIKPFTAKEAQSQLVLKLLFMAVEMDGTEVSSSKLVD